MKTTLDAKEYPYSYNHEKANQLGACISHAIKRLGTTYKKSSKGKKRKRGIFFRKQLSTQMKVAFFMNHPKTQCYVSKASRCYGNHSSRGRTNVIGALLGGKQLVHLTKINSFVSQDLIPKLPTKSIIIMDKVYF